MKMNPGDVVIVSGITSMVVVTDISFNVPHGKVTSIPGELALKSRELWDHISCGKIFWHNRPSTPQQQVAPKSTQPSVIEPQPLVAPPISNTNLQSELSKVQEESERAQLELLERVGRLEAENARLRAEGDRKSTEDDKLKTILEKLDNLSSSTVQIVSQAQPNLSGYSEPNTEEKTPYYIPTLPDARSIPGSITPKVIHTDGVDVEKASQALRKFRKQGG